MIQEMVNGSIAVLTQPSVQTFERHERDNLMWALIYAVIASVINGVINAITIPFRTSNIRAELEQEGVSGTILDVITAQSSNPALFILSGVLGTIIGSLVIWGVIYLLG